MLSFNEVVERALTGPICTERDFDLGIFVPNLRKIIEKYSIKYDPQNPVPADDDLADRVWEAGMEFLVETGVYCVDTERRILFSREEIDGALESAPRDVVYGYGKDSRLMPRRTPEDKTPPWCSGCGAGPVSTEWNLINVVKTYAEDPLSDGITAPCLTNLDGRDLVAGSPRGVEGAIRTVLLVREALRRAGRPGMPVVNEVASAVRATEHIAGHTFGDPRTDALEIGTIHELKVDFDALNKVAYCQAVGNRTFAENGVILGGFAGGPAGVAVVCAAYHPLALLLIRGVAQHPLVVPIEGGTTSMRGTIWSRCLGIQAATRHSPLPIVAPGYTSAGPMTEMCYYEFAAWVMATVVSGGSVEVGPPSRGVMEDYSDPVENIFSNAVAHASAGMGRKGANKIVATLLDRYEDKLKDPPLGKKLPDYFDIAAGTPNQACLQLYRKMRQEFTEQFGLKLPLTSPYL
ncbi:MAG: monomethylamine:corrinoid methyltransferase [Chloroflexi bacterium]|nr:monomethylamine:corrinoid methyltransferase [Chloroflexota bacterium]